MCGKDQAGQRFDAHGNGRPFWSSFRRLCRLSYAHAQVTLVAPTLDSRFIDDLPRRLIGDRAYDADPLNAGLAQLGTLDDRAPPAGSDPPQNPGWPSTMSATR